MNCMSCGKTCAKTPSTFILQEPNDLRGWRAQLCDDCEEGRDERPVQARVVGNLRRLARESAMTRSIERV